MLTIGTQVRLSRTVDRRPHFEARAGLTGVVESADGGQVWVKMDAPLRGCQMWRNCIVWDDPVSYRADVEVVALPVSA